MHVPKKLYDFAIIRHLHKPTIHFQPHLEMVQLLLFLFLLRRRAQFHTADYYRSWKLTWIGLGLTCVSACTYLKTIESLTEKTSSSFDFSHANRMPVRSLNKNWLRMFWLHILNQKWFSLSRLNTLWWDKNRKKNQPRSWR